MISITINGQTFLVEKGNNILQVCEFLNIEIPRFCYHKELSVAGNCRMCLVEVEKFPKPIASCAMPVTDNMVVYTDSPLVRKARESVLEFMLINHPLDCPICDQGGECDLQDQTFEYGSDSSRFFFKNKRAVEDKNFGYLIKTVMTRCIHCTRCVRFADEIAGVDLLGTSGRGTHVEIGFYIDQIFNSELSGNVIDLCPVGALTAKPYAFKYRSWELSSYPSIDLNDSLGVNIQVDVRNNEVIRIKPLYFPEINDSWITDKARFSFDGVFNQQVLQPFIGHFKLKDWFTIYALLYYFQSKKTNPFTEKIFLAGESLGLNTINAYQQYAYSQEVKHIEGIDLPKINSDFETAYKLGPLNSFKDADVILIISSNLRYELPNLNIKLKELKKKNITIAYIGNYYENTYEMAHLGISDHIFTEIAKGKHWFSSLLKKAKCPRILIGTSLEKSITTFNLAEQFSYYLNYKKNIIHFLNIYASSINFLDLGVIPIKKRKFNINDKNAIYSLNTNSSYTHTSLYNNTTIISFGPHFSNKFSKNTILVPTQNDFEFSDQFINLEGRLQKTTKILSLNNGKFNTKKGDDIFTLNSKKSLENIKKLPFYQASNLNNSNFIVLKKKSPVIFKKIKGNFAIKNFYKTSTITLLSKTMTSVSKKYHNFKNFK